MRELARNNLYFKGFPTSGESADQMTEELREYFSKFGEIKSLRICTKTVLVEGHNTE